MKKLINPVIMVAGAVALGGCVLSTPDAVGTGDVVRTNGLPFASDEVTGGGTLSTAVTGHTANTPSVSYAAGSGGGSFQESQITVAGVDANTIQITLNGATADLTRFGQSYGATIDGVTHGLGVFQQGTAVSTYQYARLDSANLSESRIIRFVIGNDTNPANLIGTASYTVLLSGTGAEFDNGRVRGLDISGTGTIDANFTTNAVNGTIRFGTSDSSSNNNFRAKEFSITGTRSGAAFTSTAVRTDCPVTDTCTSNTNLSGNFYGENGREIAGVGIVHETRTTSTGPVEIKGSFAFINK